MDLDLSKNNEHSYDIINSINKRVLGNAVMYIDGNYYFSFDCNSPGNWSSDNLKQISKVLDKLNSDYENNVKKNNIK
jgi:hypothetical protein